MEVILSYMGLKKIGGTWQWVWKLLPHFAHCSEAPMEWHTAHSRTSACREPSDPQDCMGEAVAGWSCILILRHLWTDYKSNMISYCTLLKFCLGTKWKYILVAAPDMYKFRNFCTSYSSNIPLQIHSWVNGIPGFLQSLEAKFQSFAYWELF